MRARLADQLRVPSSRMATLPQPSVASRSRHRQRSLRRRFQVQLPRQDTSPALEALSFLWSLRSSGGSLGRLVRQAQGAQSLFTPGSAVDQLLGPDLLDPERLAR